MELTKLEHILSKKGRVWTHEERIVVIGYFYLRFFNKGIAILTKGGVPLEENQNKKGGGNSAMDMMQTFFTDILEKGCSYDPDNENNRGSIPVKKFEAFFYVQVSIRLKFGWYNTPSEADSLEKLKNLETNKTIGDTIPADEFTPEQQFIWNELLDEKQQQWKIAKECLEKLKGEQHKAIFTHHFEKKTYEEILRMGIAKSYGALRANICRGKAKMADLLAKQGINYLELIDETEGDN